MKTQFKSLKNYYDFIGEDKKHKLSDQNKVDNVEVNSFEYVLSIYHHYLRGGNTWTSTEKNHIILKNGFIYGGWIDDGSGKFLVDFIGGNAVLGVTKDNFYGPNAKDYNPNTGRYIVCRNQRSLVVIDETTFNVIDEQYYTEGRFLDNSRFFKPVNPETKEPYELDDVSYTYSGKNFQVQGFDVADGLAYKLDYAKDSKSFNLNVCNVEMICLFNRALQARKAIKFNPGTEEEAKIKKIATILNLQNVPSNLDVSSDTDDDEYLDIFGSNTSGSTKTSSGGSKISDIHQSANNDFYLRYLDWLMRVMYTGKTNIAELVDSSDKTKVLKEFNKTELNESFFKILIHFLKKYRKASNENDACMLIFLIKSVQKHLEKLIHIQKPVINVKDYKKKSVVIKPTTLKKLYDLLKKMKDDVIPDLKCSIFYYKQGISKSCDLLFKLLGRHRTISIPDKIREILTSVEDKYSFDECFEIFGLLIPKRLRNLLKTKKNADSEEQQKLNSIEKITE